MKKILFLLLCFSATSTWATCERDDVEYYLEKGFSPEQITSLCAASSPRAEPQLKSAQPVVDATPAQQLKLGQEQILADLVEALIVEDLALKNGQLIFLQRFKAKFGEKDVFGNLQAVKPSMQVAIDLSSMRLIRAAKRIPIIRGAYVMLSGDIQQNLIDSEQYSAKELAGINEFLAEEVGQNTLKIKIHRDADVNDIAAKLQELSLLYRAK